MIPYNTRMNFTVNGPLHLGHAYITLINAHEAHRSGGKFGVRLEDDQRLMLWKYGQSQTEEFCRMQREDLDWLGIDYQFWDRESEMKPRATELMDYFHYTPEPEKFVHALAQPEVIGIAGPWYTYVPSITAYKAIYDFLEDVNWLIRGIDLLGEENHYRSFVDRFELWRQIRTTYIPRLYCAGHQLAKTFGKNKLRDYRKAGVRPNELIEMLADDCLIIPANGWVVDNIKPNPSLGGWADEILGGME
jgi:glutamyl/glutaminyl-tRNA synthetase